MVCILLHPPPCKTLHVTTSLHKMHKIKTQKRTWIKNRADKKMSFQVKFSLSRENIVLTCTQLYFPSIFPPNCNSQPYHIIISQSNLDIKVKHALLAFQTAFMINLRCNFKIKLSFVLMKMSKNARIRNR